MKIETMKDVLHWTEKFHQQLSLSLKNSKNNHASERARLVLDYLAQHEKALSKVISGFENSGNTQVMNTWCIEYLDTRPINSNSNAIAALTTLNPDEIVAAVVEQHQQVIELYRYLVTRVDTPEAKELMQELLAFEEHEIMRIVHTANRFSDM